MLIERAGATDARLGKSREWSDSKVESFDGHRVVLPRVMCLAIPWRNHHEVLPFWADLPGIGPTFLIRMSPGKSVSSSESMSPGESRDLNGSVCVEKYVQLKFL